MDRDVCIRCGHFLPPLLTIGEEASNAVKFDPVCQCQSDASQAQRMNEKTPNEAEPQSSCSSKSDEPTEQRMDEDEIKLLVTKKNVRFPDSVIDESEETPEEKPKKKLEPKAVPMEPLQLEEPKDNLPENHSKKRCGIEWPEANLPIPVILIIVIAIATPAIVLGIYTDYSKKVHVCPFMRRPITSKDDYGALNEKYDNESSYRKKNMMEIIDSEALLTKQDKLDNLRLPKSLVPDSYYVKLTPFIWEHNFTFHGYVRIMLNVTEDTRNITLHADESLHIDEVYTGIYEKPNKPGDWPKRIRRGHQYHDTEREFHIIETKDTLKKGRQYELTMKYVGNISDKMTGFYRSYYVHKNKTRWIAVTHMQPTHARKVFPCFDEPVYKATFQFSVAHPRHMTAISNMRKKLLVKSDPVEGLPNYVWDHFEPTPPMSTYIGAIAVTDFPNKSVKRYNEPLFRVWAREDAIEQAEYSLKIGPKLLKYFEDYFNITYPLQKTDMIAVPDFQATAMENWGLITFNELAMLHKPGVSNADSKLIVATTVSHEILHQWFGNLVTPKWWSDLWLNEGFATYMQYLGVHAVEPSWKAHELFVVDELHNAFFLDSLKSSHPIVSQVVLPSEIDEAFDGITYAKGAALIRMMKYFLTEATFQRALTNYLKKREFQIADQDDLWKEMTTQGLNDTTLKEQYDHKRDTDKEESITEANPLKVESIMYSWTHQEGYPVVQIGRPHKSHKFEPYAVQSRYALRDNTKKNDKDKDKDLWWIPLTWTTANNSNFSDTEVKRWMRKQRFVFLDKFPCGPEDWIIVNIRQAGYYRVNYDLTNWELLTKQLKDNKTVIPAIHRAQLIDDAFNLARTRHLDYYYAMNMSEYLVEETDYIPWRAFFKNFRYLDNMLYTYPDYGMFRAYVMSLLEKIYWKLGFDFKSTDSMLTNFTRTEVLLWVCEYSYEDCVNRVKREFEYWRRESDPDSNNPITPDLKPVVYCNAVRYGGPVEWNFIWQRYLNVNVASEKDLLLDALGCTRISWLIHKYLHTALNDKSVIRGQDLLNVFKAVSNNHVGNDIALRYIVKHWEFLMREFKKSTMVFDHIFRWSTQRFSTLVELQDLYGFYLENRDKKNLGSAKRAIEQAVDETEANIEWINDNAETIRDWLKQR